MTDPQKQPDHPVIPNLPPGWTGGVIPPGPVIWEEPSADPNYLLLGLDGDALHQAGRLLATGPTGEMQEDPSTKVLLPKITLTWATMDELMAYLEKVPRACAELGFPHGTGLIELCWVSGSAGNWVIEGTLVWAAFKEAPQAVPWLMPPH